MNSVLNELRLSLEKNAADIHRKKWAVRISEEDLRFKDLLSLIHDPYPVAMRFSWLTGHLCEINPAVVRPHVSYFFQRRHAISIPNFDRSLAKMCWLCGIPKEMEGEIVDLLFQWISDPGISVSTKSYALVALIDFVKREPALRNELLISIENQLGKNSVSFEKKIVKAIKQLKSLP